MADAFELADRGRHIAAALIDHLPSAPGKALQTVIKSLGPTSSVDGFGLQPFFYYPHSCVIAELGPKVLRTGLKACYELTGRFTAEFAIRPLIG